MDIITLSEYRKTLKENNNQLDYICDNVKDIRIIDNYELNKNNIEFAMKYNDYKPLAYSIIENNTMDIYMKELDNNKITCIPYRIIDRIYGEEIYLYFRYINEKSEINKHLVHEDLDRLYCLNNDEYTVKNFAKNNDKEKIKDIIALILIRYQ